MKARWTLIGLLLVALSSAILAQEPVDLFSDSVKLADGYLRIGSWNLRHINLEGGQETSCRGTLRMRISPA